jgi:hypothetical protein
MSWFKKLLQIPATLINAVRYHFEERTAQYTIDFNETEFRKLRNGIVIKTAPWAAICKAELFQFDRLTTECECVALRGEQGEFIAITDYEPKYLDFINFLDTPFPGLGQIATTYFMSILGKMGTAEWLVLELKIGEPPKIISGKIDHKQP